MSYIYINGCSFTWGDGLEKSSTYPYIIKDKLKSDIQCDAERGNSNHKIHRVSHKHILENHSKIKTVVIQWTFPDRYEYWEKKKNDKTGDNQSDWLPILPNYDNEASKAYYKNIYSDYHSNTDHMNESISLALLCEHYNIPYFFFEVDSSMQEYFQLPNNKQIEKMFKVKFPSYFDWKQSWNGIIERNNFKREDGFLENSHPTAESQKLMAKIIIFELTSTYSIYQKYTFPGGRKS